MPVDYAQIHASLSSPKLQAYKNPLGYTGNANAVKAYYLLGDVSQHLFAPLQLIELALRNITNTALIKKTGKNNWYDTIPIHPVSINHVIDAKSRAARDLQGKRIPLPDDIVSRLPFGFWISIYDEPYRDQTKPNFIWDPKTRASAFPNIPHSLTFKLLHARLSTSNQLRNRLFHHEPVWKSNKIKTLDDAVKIIHLRYGELLETLSWLSPEAKNLLLAWGFEGRFNMACQNDRFDRPLW